MVAAVTVTDRDRASVRSQSQVVVVVDKVASVVRNEIFGDENQKSDHKA